MDTVEWLELLGVFLTCTFKFGIAGVPLAIFGAKYSFLKTLMVTVSGGFSGTLIFTYLSVWLIQGIKKVKEKYANGSKKTKKKFTFTNKLIVRVKNRFGLLGLAFLTPSLLSIPLGCFLAVRYYKNVPRILFFMFTSILLWAVALGSSLQLIRNMLG